MNLTFVFPGQGAQTLGMGKELANSFGAARLVFEEIDDALNEKLSSVIWGDCPDSLNLTVNAQPALMATSMAALKTIEAEGFDLTSVFLLAGHSLGEYTAYCAAQSISLADTARLLRIRGEAMQKSVPLGEGSMAALLGLDIAKAESVANEASKGGVCEVANDNDPKQVVISGSTEQVEKAIELAKNSGARRCVRLNTSAPFHCSLMQPAAECMQEALSEVEFLPPKIPIVSNVSVSIVRDADMAIDLLTQQVMGRVRWRETILKMQDLEVQSTVEIGVGQTLSGMIRRTAPSINTSACGTLQHVDEFMEQFAK